MRIGYFTSGVSGLGRIVRGIAIGLALRRRGVTADFRIFHSSSAGPLVESFGLGHCPVPVEAIDAHSRDRYRSSPLHAALTGFRPDVLIVDLMWFPVRHMLADLPGRKLLLLRQVDHRFFRIPRADEVLELDPSAYDDVLAIEPFDWPFPCRLVPPIVIRNPDEILPADEARRRLGIEPAVPACLVALSGPPDELARFDRIEQRLRTDGYRFVRSTNGERFPIVDYFNAFDRIVTTAGYNSFWETRRFAKEAEYVTIARQFEDQALRVARHGMSRPPSNGADVLVSELLA